MRFSIGKVIGCCNYGECVLISKRIYYCVWCGSQVKLYLRRIIVIKFYNSEFIQNLSDGFSLQGERVFHVNLCVLVCGVIDTMVID